MPAFVVSLLAGPCLAACGAGTQPEEPPAPGGTAGDQDLDAMPGDVVTTPIPDADEGPRARDVDAAHALRAGGNEPFWSIEVTPGALVLSRLGEPDVEAADPVVVVREDGRRTYRAAAAGVIIDAGPTICRDDMSGTPHPFDVTVSVGDTRLRGCGGDPSTLLVGDWRVVEIAGEPTPDDAAPTFSFDLEEGTVAGGTGCNRFRGELTRTGESLSFGPLATTRRACLGPAMDVEQRFLAVMADVVRFDVGEDGRLRLETPDGRVIVARER